MIASLPQRVCLASDHAGFALKQAIATHLQDSGAQILDLGPATAESCDYPTYAHKLCGIVLEQNIPGILICGTGIGMSIAANRHTGIRAALCTHEFHAVAAREHNNANILCLGERVTAPGLASRIVSLFLSTSFEGGRHARRVSLMEPVAQSDGFYPI